ncbi:LLM class flavin-dependent oxidoreductase [Amphritea opalescens]|uniref:LLM class flavin-dependent oxidoreductase n=1 Tax=Amphritea opalescens TaxID=2490544 RepID=A0A430KQV9_9GAMM|nr:LLM class flavin-dependent oxidoreductase [Amphritea opalescens]RTE65733.1 LLM class flavin-dependent oxidoreductase [Amphritea opalescens]
MSLKLSVIDQSPAHNGQSQTAGLHYSTQLAQLCEELGYHRFWIAEHHDTPSYSSSCPEILIAHIAQNTHKIRVGSGGVMLSHYSPLKVAEVFRTLEALNPGRIDLGVGRAPGGTDLTSQALAFPNTPNTAALYPQLLSDLSGFLHDNLPTNHPFSGINATPINAAAPQLWTLGSSSGSVDLAAELGLGFVLALFIGTHDRPAEIFARYQAKFRPNDKGIEQPQTILSVACLAADNQEEAAYLAAPNMYWKVMAFRHGIREHLRSPEEALSLYNKLPLSDQAYYQETLNSVITGSGEECRAELEQLAEHYHAQELMLVNVTHDFEDRCNSYRKLMNAFTPSA